MRETTCKHYRGTVNDTCERGVNLRQLVGGPDLGWATRLPCIPHCEAKDGCKANCDKYEQYTAEELAAIEAELEEAMSRMEKVGPLVSRIKRENRGKGAQGVETCPVCGNKLHWSHAAINGHVWMRCETEDCIAFME